MIRVLKILILIGVYAVCFFILSKLQKTPGPNYYAEMVAKRCNYSKIKNLCYETEIPKLMRSVSMEDAFSVTELIQNKDLGFLDCHNLAHKLSEIESQKVGWQNTALHCPLATCNYGCLHGAFAGRFRGESLDDEQIKAVMPEILNVCQPRPGFNPTDIDLAMCYHGLGHLAMYVTGGSPEKSISICEKIKTKSPGISYTNLCSEGVFMTVFHGQDTPEDEALVKYITPKKENVVSFCSKYGDYWDICRRESFYNIFSSEEKTGIKIVNFCSYATNTQMKEYCYLGAISMFTSEAFLKVDGINLLEKFCDGFPTKDRGLCYSGASMRLLQLDALRYIKISNKICTLAEKKGVGKRCFLDASLYANFIYGSGHPKERETYCSDFPEAWKKSCLFKN